MPVTGEFNTDSKALQNRINAHAKYGTTEINDWIFEHLELAEGYSVLDIGCGTGKQSIPISKIVGEKGRLLSVDISEESLNTLTQTAIEEGLDKRISLLNSDIDELYKYVEGKKFERALSSYSLYYSKNPEILIQAVFNSLVDDGIFFFCGPSTENNAEIKNFHKIIGGNPDKKLGEGAVFMETIGLTLAEEIFRKVETSQFENKIEFTSPESLVEYWKSYNLYDKNLEEKFIQAAGDYFKSNDSFVTVKRVLGIKARK